MVRSSGTISSPMLLVAALNLVQNSPRFKPCGPKAVPTGGAGVALPAGICIFTIVLIFLAIGRLYLLYLEEVKFHRGFASEHVDQDFDLAAFGVDLADFAFKVFKRPVADPDRVADFNVDFVL